VKPSVTDRRPCYPATQSIARGAYTLIELLVTIAIIGIIAALLLPAVQSARESGRRVQCANHVKNIAVGVLLFNDTNKQFPSGGWGHTWVGDPDRGSGRSQPGGWIYKILPFVEERDLHDLGAGQSGAVATQLYSQRLTTPIELFVCPTRRRCSAWPVSDKFVYMRTPKPYGDVNLVARSDYAINGGTSHIINLGGPVDYQQGDDPAYWSNAPNPIKFNGVSHLRIGAALKSFTDGASKTYLLGEKHIPADMYESGTSPGDNECMYSGYCTDLHRFAGAIENLALGTAPFIPPLFDYLRPADNMQEFVRFGSAHESGFNMACCDGSVHFMSYDIDAETHFRFGHRSDNERPLEALR
jgi:prepilin-type N-terminal cleavage/methylation domain-containing protein